MGGPARSRLVTSGLLALLAWAPSRLLVQAARPKEHEAPRLAGTWAVFKGDGEFVALEPRR